jgi:hypothetical protein
MQQSINTAEEKIKPHAQPGRDGELDSATSEGKFAELNRAVQITRRRAGASTPPKCEVT